MRVPDPSPEEIELCYTLAGLGARPSTIRELVGDGVTKLVARRICQDVIKDSSKRGRPSYSDKQVLDDEEVRFASSLLAQLFDAYIEVNGESSSTAKAYAEVYEQFCTFTPGEPLSFDNAFNFLRGYMSGRFRMEECGKCGTRHVTTLSNRKCPHCRFDAIRESGQISLFPNLKERAAA